MDVLKSKVIEKVSTKLPDMIASDVEELVSRAEEYFKNKTKRREVPEKAFWLWVDLSLAIHKNLLSDGEAVVSSVKRGDTTINYDTNKGTPLGSLNSQLRGYMVVVSK